MSLYKKHPKIAKPQLDRLLVQVLREKREKEMTDLERYDVKNHYVTEEDTLSTEEEDQELERLNAEFNQMETQIENLLDNLGLDNQFENQGSLDDEKRAFIRKAELKRLISLLNSTKKDKKV